MTDQATAAPPLTADQILAETQLDVTTLMDAQAQAQAKRIQQLERDVLVRDATLVQAHRELVEVTAQRDALVEQVRQLGKQPVAGTQEQRAPRRVRRAVKSNGAGKVRHPTKAVAGKDN